MLRGDLIRLIIAIVINAIVFSLGFYIKQQNESNYSNYKYENTNDTIVLHGKMINDDDKIVSNNETYEYTLTIKEN